MKKQRQIQKQDNKKTALDQGWGKDSADLNKESGKKRDNRQNREAGKEQPEFIWPENANPEINTPSNPQKPDSPSKMGPADEGE